MLSVEKMKNGGRPCVESGHGKNRALDWRSSIRGVETEERFVDRRTWVMAENDQFFVGALRPLLMGSEIGAWS